MPDPGVGFEYPRNEVKWLKRDALLFAKSIGCSADELHFLFVRLAPCQHSSSSEPKPKPKPMLTQRR
jgi:hypothetical protein